MNKKNRIKKILLHFTKKYYLCPMNSLDFYLAQLCGCKRDVARVAGKVGGLTDCVFTGLCGALPEAKGKGGGACVVLLLLAAVMFAGFGCCGSRKSTINTEAKEIMTEANAQTPSDDLEEAILYWIVDVKPLFDGKDADVAFREYVRKNYIIPSIYYEAEPTGRSLVQFIIEADGSISNAKTMRDFDRLLDDELLRVINSSPKWTPGIHNGKAVRVSYQFPFSMLE